MSRRFGFAFCLAAICVGVLGSRVYLSFERVRVRVITTTPQVAEGSSAAIRLPDHAGRLSGQPTAVILRVRGTAEPIDLTVALDAHHLARVTVPADREVRIDTAIDSMPDAAQEIRLQASRPGWSVTYLELATVHGFSGAPVPLVIVPHARMRDGLLPTWAWLPLLVAFIALRPRPDWPAGRRRHLFRIAAGLVLLLFAATLLAHRLTPYGVLLSLQTFLLCAAVLYAEPLSRVWTRLTRRMALEHLRTRVAPPFPGRREILLAFGGLTVVVAVLLHVQLRNLYSVPDLGDPLFSIWRIAWVLHQLAADPRHLFDANIFYPAGNTLTYSDSIILPSIMSLPLLRAGLHPVVAYNVLLLSGFVLSGLATYVLGRCLGFGVVAAWTSAVIFSVYPFRLDHFSHLELQMAQWMPLALLGAHRLMLVGGWRYVAWTALAIGAQWYSSMYYALFLSVYVAAFALVLGLVWREWRRLALVASAVVLGACLALPLARAYSQSDDERGERPLWAIRELSATPADYLQPTGRSALYAGVNPEPGHAERALFPGIVPVVLAVAGACPPLTPTRLALLLSGVVAFDGSLGMNGLSYPLLYEYLFPFRSVRVPARFAILVGLTLALLSGAALERWRDRGRLRLPAPLVAAGVTVLLLVDAWPSLEVVPVWREPPPVYGGLGPSSGAVLMEYPIPGHLAFPENLPYLYFSAWHLTPTINGYSGFVSRGYKEMAEAMEGFPGGETVPYLTKLGVTHISVICAIDGSFGRFGVPVMDRAKCDETISQLDADPRLRLVVRADWEGAPALLYQIRR